MSNVTSLDEFRKKRTANKTGYSGGEDEQTLKALTEVRDGVSNIQSYVDSIQVAFDRGEKLAAFKTDNDYVMNMFRDMVRAAFKELDYQIGMIYSLLSTGDPEVFPELKTMEKVFSDFERVFNVMSVNNLLNIGNPPILTCTSYNG